MKPTSVVISITYDNNISEIIDLEVNDKLTILRKGDTVSVKGSELVEDEEEPESDLQPDPVSKVVFGK
jgi:hypothetical protein